MRKPAAPGAPAPEPPPPGGRALQRARQFADARGLEPPQPEQESAPPATPGPRGAKPAPADPAPAKPPARKR